MFNVERYIERCLRSLLVQDIPLASYEIICINDGSPDGSKEIVKDIQKEYANILLIDQENKGVSVARNNGIKKARGKYLLFVDPDDYIDGNSLLNILRSANDNIAQVTFLGYTFLNEDGTARRKLFYENHKDTVYSGVEAYSVARADGRTDPDRLWAVLLDSAFIKSRGFYFLPDVPFLEDGELLARILCQTERCIFNGQSFYQRTTRPGSATNSKLFYSEKSTKGFIAAASNLLSFQKREELMYEQKQFLNQPIAKFIFLAIESALGAKSMNKLTGTIKDTICITAGNLNLMRCEGIYKIYGRAYNLSPYLCAIILLIYPKFRIMSEYIKSWRKRMDLTTKV